MVAVVDAKEYGNDHKGYDKAQAYDKQPYRPEMFEQL